MAARRHHVRAEYDYFVDAPLAISSYLHCSMCLDEWKRGVDQHGMLMVDRPTPAEYSRTQIGITPYGWQVWCVRHDVNVAHIKVTVADGAKAAPPPTCQHESHAKGGK